MTYFPERGSLPVRDLFAGVRARLVWGERIMLSLVEMEAGTTVPSHSHPNEQAGVVLEGEFVFEIGGQRKRLRQGDLYFIPAHVPHGVVEVPTRAVALDIFSPPREEYKTQG